MNEIFRILSWNISWGAMTANETSKNDISAKYLAYYKCYNFGNVPNPSCKDNVINYLKKLNSSFHFIGLQEAAKWNDIYKELKNKYAIIHSRSGIANLVTLYRNNIYKYKDHINDFIHTSGRPYHIILFKHILTNNNYIIINLHNGHNTTKNELEITLSKGIDKIKSININKHYRTIIFGDFNDHGNYNYWKGFYPFKYSKFKNLQNIKVKCKYKPPNTCCIGKSFLRTNINQDLYYGDYILVDNNFTVKLKLPNPKIFNYNAHIYPTSDHLPIIGKIFNYNAHIYPIYKR